MLSLSPSSTVKAGWRHVPRENIENKVRILFQDPCGRGSNFLLFRFIHCCFVFFFYLLHLSLHVFLFISILLSIHLISLPFPFVSCPFSSVYSFQYVVISIHFHSCNMCIHFLLFTSLRDGNRLHRTWLNKRLHLNVVGSDMR